METFEQLTLKLKANEFLDCFWCGRPKNVKLHGTKGKKCMKEFKAAILALCGKNHFVNEKKKRKELK